MARLLLVHHTPSPTLHSMFEQVVAGATTPELEGVELVRVPALTAGPSDVLAADGCLLGTPANIGYMSGALKHFFDQIYYPCLDAARKLPFGLYVHGNDDTAGAVHGVEAITSGMGWRQAAEHVLVTGEIGQQQLDACWELGASVAASLE